jgi:hypothetical protein
MAGWMMYKFAKKYLTYLSPVLLKAKKNCGAITSKELNSQYNV